MGDTWYLDELFVTIQGRRQYLWRAVDEDGDVIDILVQSRRNRRAAERFFRKLLKSQGREKLTVPVPMLMRMFEKRLRTYRAIGYKPVELTGNDVEAVSELTVEYDVDVFDYTKR